MNRPPLPTAFCWLGPPLAALFCTAVALRRSAYALGLKGRRHAEVPVLSIGNLTTGGTGKTPAVAYLAGALKKRGYSPAVVLRGYGAPARGALNDEGLELSRALPDIPVIANPNRAAGAAEAARRGARVVVLDDGFQHWALARDFDLVLLDATDPFGGGHRLPWGYLRESPAALSRAHAILITRADDLPPAQLDALKLRIRSLAPRATVGTARHRPVDLRALTGTETPPELSALGAHSVFAVCGLARPDRFNATLAGLGVTVAGSRCFPDHHAFTAADLRSCAEAAQACGAEAIVITEKDASKWEAFSKTTASPPIWVLRIAFELIEGESALWDSLDAVLRKTP